MTVQDFGPVCKAPRGKGPRTKKAARRRRELQEPKRVLQPKAQSRVALVAQGRVIDVKPF